MKILDRGDVEAAVPPLLVNPAIQAVGPVGAVGVDAARDGEALAIEFEDGDVAELIAVGIEELVVVDVVVRAENPFAVGAEIGLRRFALDLVMESLLPLVGVRQIELVGEEESCGEHACGYDDWRDDAVDAGSRGFNRCDFIRALHQPESDENGQQHHQRRNVVEEIRSDVEQILGHDLGGNLVAENISQQLEQREHEHQHQEGGENQSQIQKEIAQDVVVEQSGKSGAEQAVPRRGALKGILPPAGVEWGRGLLRLPGTQRTDLKGTFFGAQQKKESEGKENEVRHPRAEPGRYSSLPSQRHTHQRNYVISENEKDGQHESAGLAALFRRQAEGNADQREHQACRRQREAAVKFD